MVNSQGLLNLQNKMKVALYLRVSTFDQTSLNQELELKLYCKANSYTIFKIYKDEGVSGTKKSRPELASGYEQLPKFDV